VEGVRKDVVQIGIVVNCRQKVLAVLLDDDAVIRVVKWQRVFAVLGDDAAVIRVVNGRLKVLAVFGDDAL
jgi:hypothetical protein